MKMKQLQMLALYFVAVVIYLAQFAEGDCQIKSDDKMGSSQILLWSSGNAIVYPEGTRTVTIAEGDTVILSCQGTEKALSLVSAASIPGLNADAKMVGLNCSNSHFYYAKATNQVLVESVSCTDAQAPTMIKTKSVCSPMGADGRTTDLEELFKVQVGWNGPQNFLPQIELCIDERIYGTLWTKFTIHGKSILSRDTTVDRPTFKTDVSGEKRFFAKWYSTAVNTAYNKKSQASRMQELLGANLLAGSSVPIIDLSDSSDFYLARGHISPDAAFVYDVEQDATYYFINVAPQFQTFNNGNWKAMENAARNYADMQQRDISVYSGVYGILQFPHITTKAMTNLTLLTQGTLGKGYLPVPKYYWMVIHDPKVNEAIFVIGLNNPYASKFDETFCKQSVCGSVKGIPAKHSDPARGLLQCCQMSQDLLSKIPYLPNLAINQNVWPTLISQLYN